MGKTKKEIEKQGTIEVLNVVELNCSSVLISKTGKTKNNRNRR